MAETTGNEIQQGAQQAVNAGVKTARAAKAVQSAAKKAATGNYVGAAVEVLKNETTRKVIACIVLFSIFLTIVIFFIAPLALYESITSAAEALAEKWKVGYYEGTSGRFVSTFRALIGLFKDDSIDNALSVTNGSEDEATTEDLKLMGDKAALTATYARKIKAIQDKIEARQKLIKKNIEANDGPIYGYFAGRYQSEYAHKYDGDEYTRAVYDGANIDVITRTVSTKTALHILSLYSTQIGSSVDNIKLSGLLKWLGYNAGGSKYVDFPIDKSGIASGRIQAWTGTFMPQYLIDEATKRGQLEDYQKKYGCSVVDFLIQVNAPSLSGIAACETPIPVTEQRIRWSQATLYYRDYPSDGSMRPWYNSYSRQFVFPYQSFVENGGNYIASWSDYYQMYIPVRVMGDPAPAVWRSSTVYVKKMVDVEITEIHVSYSVPISISTRPYNDLVEMVGFWEGWLPSDPLYNANAEKPAA